MPISKINNLSIADGAIAINDFSATGTPSASTFLRGDNSWASAGGNAPYFRAISPGATGLTDGAYTKIDFSTEVFDSNSCYDAANSKFLPTTAGYYWIDLSILFYGTPGGNPMSNAIAIIYKNGANTISNNNGMNVNGNNVFYFYLCRSQHIIYFNGTTDYIEPYGVINSSGQRNYDGGNCAFQGFKIG